MARRVLRWLLAAFFIAAGTNHFRMPGYDFAAATLWLRLPLQAALIAWVAWVSLVRERGPGRCRAPQRRAPLGR